MRAGGAMQYNRRLKIKNCIIPILQLITIVRALHTLLRKLTRVS